MAILSVAPSSDRVRRELSHDSAQAVWPPSTTIAFLTLLLATAQPSSPTEAALHRLTASTIRATT